MNPTQPAQQAPNTEAIKAALLARGQQMAKPAVQGGQPAQNAVPPQGAQPPVAPPQQAPQQPQMGQPPVAAGNPEAKIILGAMASRLKILPVM